MSEMLNVLLLVMMLGVGVYGLYTVIRLKRSMELFANRFLYPANCKPEDCTDVAGFISFILPRLLILSVVSLILGIALALYWYVLPLVLPWWIDLLVIPLLAVGALVWYMTVQSRAYKLYW